MKSEFHLSVDAWNLVRPWRQKGHIALEFGRQLFECRRPKQSFATPILHSVSLRSPSYNIHTSHSAVSCTLRLTQATSNGRRMNASFSCFASFLLDSCCSSLATVVSIEAWSKLLFCFDRSGTHGSPHPHYQWILLTCWKWAIKLNQTSLI